MTMADIADTVVAFVKLHKPSAAPIVFALAFGESLAFVSLLFPATVMLWGIGALIGAGGLDFWPIWLAAVLGAGLGDWLSYWLGYIFHEPIGRLWPLSRYPGLLPRGHAFFAKWGAIGVFTAKFFGPLRAAVPLAAGIAQMPAAPFQLANWASALAWAFLTLAPGAVGLKYLLRWLG
ncbi:MAG: DedA family protein [Pseudomonadota bacterium]|nr:DedA family protein [Pseudomonadota bacterium]